MRLATRATLCLLPISFCGSSLVAQTFTFGQPKSVLTSPPGGLFQLQFADVNGDGKTDLILPAFNVQDDVFLGDGTGGFSTTPIAANTWAFGPYSPAPMWIDVNGDGFSDQVFGTNTYYDPGGLNADGEFAVALGDGKGHFTMTTDLGSQLTGSAPDDSALVAGDFNGDGKIDFALLTGGGPDGNGGSYGPAITLFFNTGNGKFAQQNPMWLERGGSIMVGGDFNGDGKRDLAWMVRPGPLGTYQLPYPISYAYGKGDGTFGAVQTYWVDTAPLALASGDLNGDHKTDLVVALMPLLNQFGQPVSGSTYRIAALLAKQTSGFYWASAVSSTTSTNGLELMDLNNDGHLDAIYDLDFLRAGLAGGGWGPHQIVTGQAPPSQLSNDLPFAPLVKGGLPAVFSQSVDSAGHTHLNIQLNTSK